MPYTQEEKIQIIKWIYGGNSVADTINLFIAAFENRPIPSRGTISHIVHNFEQHGFVSKCKCKRNVPRVNEEKEARNLMICASAEQDPSKSCRKIADEIGINKSTVQEILRKNGYRSYKICTTQQLFPEDRERRMVFCENVMERANGDDNFINRICFTDESSFALLGKHNSSVVRFWSRENPHVRMDYRTQYPQKLNVWAGIIGNNVIGPFFIDGNLNGQRYLELLQNQIIPSLQQLPVDFQQIFYQQDGCPAHNTVAVQAYLNDTFPNRVISTRGTIPWPARSPDLSVNDFFFWGYIKEIIYKHERLSNLNELRQKIIDAFATVTPEMLTNVRQSFYNRMGYCLATEGGLFEHLL